RRGCVSSVLAQHKEIIVNRVHPRLGRLLALALVAVLAIAVSACSGEIGSGIPVTTPDVTTPDLTTPEVSVPEVTTPPATETPDETAPEDSEEVPVWVWVLLGLLVVGLVSWMGARSGSRRDTPPPVAVVPSQPDSATIARTAYADARWLYDQLTPGLATWKGDTQHAIQSGSGAGLSDRNAVWSEADTRLKTARDALYNVESMNPQAPIGGAATDLVTSLNSVREGVDRLAAARAATLKGDGSAEAEAAANDDLATRRSGLQTSLTQFSQYL
ncbi:MAG: hypothetical protein ACR2NL_00075, partial [Acidimicrobiia bacterium]